MGKNKVLLILTLIFMLSLKVSANELCLTYRQMKGSRVLGVALNAPNISYRFQIRQTNEGYFSVESPPFLVANIKDRLRIGEIKDAKLFTLLIDPFSKAVRNLDFSFTGKSGNFINIKSPTFNPVLSGLALSYGHIDIIALSPVFNPRSPTGFGAILHKDNSFLGLMLSSQNDMRLKDRKQGFQQDWSNLGSGKAMVFMLLGGHEDIETENFIYSAAGAFQLAYDRLLGGGSVILCSLKAENDILRARIYKRVGKGGVQLKELESKENPDRTLGFELQTGKEDFSISAEYSSDTFEIPIYGGQSQRREISYTVGAKYVDLEIRAQNMVAYENDRGKVQSTIYSLDAKAHGATLSAQVTMNRHKEAYLSDAKLRFRDANASLTLENGKAIAELSWSYEKDGMTMKLSVNQDRQLTVSLRFRGL